jgi:hypothetical protein
MLAILCEMCFAEQDAIIVAEGGMDVNTRLKIEKMSKIE